MAAPAINNIANVIGGVHCRQQPKVFSTETVSGTAEAAGAQQRCHSNGVVWKWDKHRAVPAARTTHIVAYGTNIFGVQLGSTINTALQGILGWVL